MADLHEVARRADAAVGHHRDVEPPREPRHLMSSVAYQESCDIRAQFDLPVMGGVWWRVLYECGRVQTCVLGTPGVYINLLLLTPCQTRMSQDSDTLH